MSHRRTTRGRLPLLTGALAGVLGLTALLNNALGASDEHPAQPLPNPNCSLMVPQDPLSARGLATPYELFATDDREGTCHENNAAQSAFVQATVLDPATGALSVYNPLVVDRGRRPAVSPVMPTLPVGAIVGIWFGFNGTRLTLRGPGAAACVNGTNGSAFGQFAYCDAAAFFAAAGTAVSSGRLRVPPIGTGTDGAACPTTRDFGLVDQDQSDNVTTTYLSRDGRTAQDTAANRVALTDAVALANGSDNLLLTSFVDPALGCLPWTAPDLADPGHQVTALALDEIQANARQMAPIALVPRTDPMVLGPDGRADPGKLNLYRTGVDQPAVGAPGSDGGSGVTYCVHLVRTAKNRLQLDKGFFEDARSPVRGESLLNFLRQRLLTSETILACKGD